MSTETPALYRNDAWSLADDFGLGAAGDQVARMALEVDPPFTIGVTGKWGSGKTSVMRRAFVTLGGQPIQQPLMFSESATEDTGGVWKASCHDDSARKVALKWPKATRDLAEQCLCVWYSPW
ncbi:P-loop NTPase fold protein [uncultured Thiodictyon sp.]|uniref:P-loop NTPase fold protein n=1 Tax=uncultured Thiodictyon sp. TaxID=1846217 RepID=UPI0025DBE7F7|nr:P-loop NTPase fold protein [uncultured Thiodictyon sp.]